MVMMHKKYLVEEIWRPKVRTEPNKHLQMSSSVIESEPKKLPAICKRKLSSQLPFDQYLILAHLPLLIRFQENRLKQSCAPRQLSRTRLHGYHMNNSLRVYFSNFTQHT